MRSEVTRTHREAGVPRCAPTCQSHNDERRRAGSAREHMATQRTCEPRPQKSARMLSSGPALQGHLKKAARWKLLPIHWLGPCSKARSLAHLQEFLQYAHGQEPGSFVELLGP